MQRKTLFASLGLVIAGLTAAWAFDGRGQIISGAGAVEQSYVRGFFASQPHLWNASGGGFDASLIRFATSHIAGRLELDQAQRVRLDDLVKLATTAYEQARSDPAFGRERLHALPLPEQLAAVRAMARKADAMLADIEAPLAAFHASLDAGQQQKLTELMAERHGSGDQGGHGHGGRGSWWHRRS